MHGLFKGQQLIQKEPALGASTWAKFTTIDSSIGTRGSDRAKTLQQMIGILFQKVGWMPKCITMHMVRSYPNHLEVYPIFFGQTQVKVSVNLYGQVCATWARLRWGTTCWTGCTDGPSLSKGHTCAGAASKDNQCEFTWAVFYEGTNADRSFFFISNLWSPYRSSHGPTVAIAYGKAAVHKSCLWHRSREYCTPTHVMAIRKPDTKEHRSNGCHRKLQSLAGLVSLGFLALHVGPEYLYPLFPVGPGYLPIYRSI